jgi:hypothetical protein
MLGVLPFLMGFQLILNALLFDVQFSARSSREMLAVRPRRSESYGQIVKMRERTSCFDDGVSKPLEKLERFEEDQ